MRRGRVEPLAGGGRVCLAVALALAGLGAAPALGDRNAGELRDAANRFQIAIASGWRTAPPPAGTLVAGAAEGGRGLLAVTRIDAGTRNARDEEALADEVIRGVERATRGFRLVRRKVSRSTRAAALDLSYERAGPSGRELVLSRYLFFTRHTVVLSIGLGREAGRAEKRAAEAMVRSFTPLD